MGRGVEWKGNGVWRWGSKALEGPKGLDSQFFCHIHDSFSFLCLKSLRGARWDPINEFFPSFTIFFISIFYF